MKKNIARLMSFFFIFLAKIRYGSRVSFGKGVILNHRFHFQGKGTLIIGDGVNLWAYSEKNDFQTYSPDAVIVVGKNSRLNGATLQCRKSITIGQDCLVGSAIMMDNDFHSLSFKKRNDPLAIKTAAVVIEDRVWIGGQSAILKGVTIGHDAVVGFRAVVTKNVAAQTVVAGNPAVVVKILD